MEGVFTCIQETELRVLQVVSLCSHCVVRPGLKILTANKQQSNQKLTKNWIVRHLINSKHRVILCVPCILCSRIQSTCCRFCITALSKEFIFIDFCGGSTTRRYWGSNWGPCKHQAKRYQSCSSAPGSSVQWLKGFAVACCSTIE